MQGLSKNKIKWIRSLQQKKFRDDLGLFVVEGEKMVLEAIKDHSDQLVFIGHTSSSEIDLTKSSFECIELSEKELQSISSLKNPNKSLAVLKIPQAKAIQCDFYLALDGVQDPGNMGTILRLADWFDVKKIICSKDTVDLYNPKVVQASMGAIFRIQVEYTDLERHISECNLPVFGALLEGENIYKKQLNPKGILVLGNEGKGISGGIIEQITTPITIPRFGKAESLNVSVATGILLSEFFRKSIH